MIVANRRAVDRENLSMLERLSPVTFTLILILGIVNLAVKSTAGVVGAFIFAAIFLTIFVITKIVRAERPYAAASITYVYLGALYTFAILFSVSAHHNLPAAVFIAALALSRFLFIDDTYYGGMLSLLAAVVFSVLSIIARGFSAAWVDVFVCLLFWCASSFFGERLCWLRLKNINSMRLAAMQKDVDRLTGLYNRQKFYEAVEAKGRGTTFRSMLVVDIDHFRQYNDTYGHRAGDAAVSAISTVIAELSAKHGLEAFRFSGEEFAVVSHKHVGEEIERIAAELVVAVRRLSIPTDATSGVITVSVGCADMAMCEQHTNEALVACAESALSTAKALGRNTAVRYMPRIMSIKRAVGQNGF